MKTRAQVLMWTAQRASALVLIVCVCVHLVTMIAAVRGGLTAAEILDRTRGNFAWAAFYALFVAAVAVHAPIGLRTMAAELLGWRGPLVEAATVGTGIALALWGWRAVWGLFL